MSQIAAYMTFKPFEYERIHFTQSSTSSRGAISALALTMESKMTVSKGKVLVVMSSANALDLKDGKVCSTGYDLNAFVISYRKLVEAGYEPVVATSKLARASKPSPTGTPTSRSIVSRSRASSQ